MELIQDNFTNPISGQDRVVAYWDGGISVSVSISEQMLDIIFEASTEYLGDHTRGLLGELKAKKMVEMGNIHANHHSFSSHKCIN